MLLIAHVVASLVCVHETCFHSRLQNVCFIASQSLAAVAGCPGGCRHSLREGFGVERINERDSLYKHVSNLNYTGSLTDLEFDQALCLPSPHPFAVIFAR